MKNRINQIIIKIVKDIKTGEYNKEGFFELFSVLDKAEFIAVTGISQEEIKDIYGDFDFVVVFSDYPDYLFINEEELSLENKINDWFSELELS